MHRRFSSNLPDLDDNTIDWEETVYLNLILQHVSVGHPSIIFFTCRLSFEFNISAFQFEYTVTVAVCTRTGAHELQILKKFSEVSDVGCRIGSCHQRCAIEEPASEQI